jgi:hypothetical protein
MAWINGKRTVRCRTCYEYGHNRRACPQASDYVKERYKSGDLARKCSYCYTAGHTRRKCEKLAVDMANDVKLNAEYRQQVAAYLLQKGIGVGTMVKRNKRDGYDLESVYVVTGIEFDTLTHREPGNYAIKVKDLHTDSMWDRSFALPLDAPHMSQHNWSTCEVVSPVEENDVKPLITDEWLTGKSGLDKFYKKPGSRS